jgi:hypothetical protein
VKKRLYLPFREVLGMFSRDVEARRAAGAITREHARRLWSALPIVVRTLVEYGPHLIDIFVPGQALLSRVETAAPDATQWHQRLRERVERQHSMTGDLEQSHARHVCHRYARLPSRQRPPQLQVITKMLALWPVSAIIGR